MRESVKKHFRIADTKCGENVAVFLYFFSRAYNKNGTNKPER